MNGVGVCTWLGLRAETWGEVGGDWDPTTGDKAWGEGQGNRRMGTAGDQRHKVGSQSVEGSSRDGKGMRDSSEGVSEDTGVRIGRRMFGCASLFWMQLAPVWTAMAGLRVQAHVSFTERSQTLCLTPGPPSPPALDPAPFAPVPSTLPRPCPNPAVPIPQQLQRFVCDCRKVDKLRPLTSCRPHCPCP